MLFLVTACRTVALLDLSACPSPPGARPAEIGGDGEEPGSDACRIAGRPPRVEGPEERLLAQVVGVSHPAGDQQEIPVDLTMMHGHELTEVVVAHTGRLSVSLYPQ